MDFFQEICDLENLRRAYRHVSANKGGPGVDGIGLDQRIMAKVLGGAATRCGYSCCVGGRSRHTRDVGK